MPQPSPASSIKPLVLQAIMALSWISTAVAWTLMELRGESSDVLRAVFGLNIVFHPVMIVVVRKRLLSPQAIDFSCLVFAAGLCAACMMLRLYSPVYGASIDLEPLYLWIPVIYVFVFTLADHRSSLKLSLAILGVFIACSLPYLIHNPPLTHANFTVQLHMVSAVLIAALYFFSSYQHRFQIAQLTADELARMANTDELTRLANRRRMTELVDAELLRCARYGHALSVILIDIDHFKSVNDQFGHAVGDQALVALAQRCREYLREVDTMGRWGGEEFVVTLPETAYEQSLDVAKALCRHVACRPLIDGHRITISCGVTSARTGDDSAKLLHRADVALYAAKHAGRNCAQGVRDEAVQDSAVRSGACA